MPGSVHSMLASWRWPWSFPINSWSRLTLRPWMVCHKANTPWDWGRCCTVLALLAE